MELKDVDTSYILSVKCIAATRDLGKRFLTMSLFLNADAFRLIPEKIARCLLILPGSIDKREMKYYENKCPNLFVCGNKKSWMRQDVWAD